MSDQLPKWVLYEISDSDEPGDAVRIGMRHRDFDGAMLLLLPDGEPGDTGWYGTERTDDGRSTRSILLFYRGEVPKVADALAWAEKRLQDGTCGLEVPFPTTFDEHEDGPEVTRAITVYLRYPPYPWLNEARLGMEMGRYFRQVELVGCTEPTESQPGEYRLRFHRDCLDTRAHVIEPQIDPDDLPF